MKKPAYLLFDIEGTTTEISFVHKVLFPYSKKRLSEFVRANSADRNVAQALQMVAQTLGEEEGLVAPETEDCVARLIDWIDADRKHPGLKKLQGMIWQQGYDDGDYQSHVYDDVLPNWTRWQALGIRLGIYSSGSAAAQKLLFRHTLAGDLTGLISDYFDLEHGAKREVDSYHRIAAAISERHAIVPGDILFLSDVAEEVMAAVNAGLGALQVVRPGTKLNSSVGAIRSFDDLAFA